METTRGDAWFDAELSFRLEGTPPRPARGRPAAAVQPDYVRKVQGDSSVRCPLEGRPAVELVPAYREAWTMGRDWRLRFELAASDLPAGATCALVLIDAGGRQAESRPLGLAAATPWRHVEFALAELSAPAGFDFARIVRARLVFRPAPATVWLDDVRFVAAAGDAEIALTDLRTADRIAREADTRMARIRELFTSKISSQPGTNLSRLFANLWLDRDVAATNRELLAIYTSTDPKVRADYGLEYTWHLAATPMLTRFYFHFGRQGRRAPGRLSPEVEQAILRLLWERTELKNDLHAAHQSTWNLTGSENHDLNAKVGNVLVSQIFRHEPDYASRVLPNRGTGPGSGYWFHKTTDTGRYHGPEGRAQPTLTGALRAADHYQAWTAFMKEYLRERARRGFFLEKSSPGYMKYTTSFLQDLYDFAEDSELRTLTGMFLDLLWAEWAQDQIRGMRGGAKTREGGVLDFQQDAMYGMATLLFGGPAPAHPSLTSYLLSDYRPPDIIWELALNRTAAGAYAYISHAPGEERPELPRPPGMERTLLCNPDSRLKRYSWVTPEFILGTRMDHPLAVHSHLSSGSCWEGIIFPTSTRAMIFPRAIEVTKNGTWRMEAEGTTRSFQSGPVLITQQSRGGVTVINPDWFPRAVQDSKPFGVYLGTGHDRLEEEQGWIFVEAGDAFLGVRPVSGRYQVSVDAGSGNKDWVDYEGAATLEEPLDPMPYEWSPDRTLVRLKDRHAPIIFEAGRRVDEGTLAAFKQRLLGNRLTLTKIVVPGHYVLTYVSGGHTYTFNAANTEIPRLDGQPIDYFPARTFDSPHLSSDYGSGLVTISAGRRRLILDFPQATRR